jgi:hypothetical protein
MCKSNLIRINTTLADGPHEKCSKQNAFNYHQIHIFFEPYFYPIHVLLTVFHIEFLFCLLLFLQ